MKQLEACNLFQLALYIVFGLTDAFTFISYNFEEKKFSDGTWLARALFFFHEGHSPVVQIMMKIYEFDDEYRVCVINF